MFRLIVTEAADVTTARLVGRLRDDGVALLADVCETARRPLVLDLSELTSASEASWGSAARCSLRSRGGSCRLAAGPGGLPSAVSGARS